MRKLTLRVTTRADGRFCKRINGRLRIWKSAGDARRDILLIIAAQETHGPLATAVEQDAARIVSVRDVLNLFMANREQKLADAAIRPGTFADYKDAIEHFAAALDQWKIDPPDSVAMLGRNAHVAALRPAHFRFICGRWAESLGPFALGRRIQAIRTAFKWARDIERVIPAVPHYGDQFSKPPKSAERAAKRLSREGRGERGFDAREIKQLLRAAGTRGAMRSMILLALNSGMYAADIASLRRQEIKAERRSTVVDTYREKTQVRQKFVLWPETAEALRKWATVRPAPATGVDPDLIFLTRYGRPWVTETANRDADGAFTGSTIKNSISLIFDQLARSVGVKRPGLSFGAFRHTHTTAAARCPDVNARLVVRGHKIGGIEESYDFHDIARLKAVTDSVRSTLLLPALKRTV